MIISSQKLFQNLQLQYQLTIRLRAWIGIWIKHLSSDFHTVTALANYIKVGRVKTESYCPIGQVVAVIGHFRYIKIRLDSEA